jgi:hypothetical protein
MAKKKIKIKIKMDALFVWLFGATIINKLSKLI